METKSFIQDYLYQMKLIQDNILEFLEKPDFQQVDFQDLVNYLFDQKLREDKNKLKSMLHLISRISANHRRSDSFFSKIEQILSIFKEEIKHNYSNFEIFTIFKVNKRVLLFLFENKIIIPDKSICSQLTNEKYLIRKYPNYFYPEFKTFFDATITEKVKTEENFESFQQKRMDGENEDYICKLIRKDSIEDFKSHVTSTNISLTSTVKPSIFETNPFLIQNHPTLIEYSAFFGSIQIFKYLQMNKVEITPSIWLYAIHGNNFALIHLLEGSRVKPNDVTFTECFIESLSCQHNDMTNYVFNNLLMNEFKKDFDLFKTSLKCYNFIYFSDILLNELNILDDKNAKNYDIFYDFCQYDYFSIVEIFLKEKMIDINLKRINNLISNKKNFFYEISMFYFLSNFYLI